MEKIIVKKIIWPYGTRSDRADYVFKPGQKILGDDCKYGGQIKCRWKEEDKCWHGLKEDRTKSEEDIKPIAYYNEFDPKAAEWLKVLIEQELIPFGIVDTRSIKDVRANDLLGFTQCHFFAGIGGWSYALELAGIDPGEPLWTGSCPCQPYSQAGKGEGFDDERDLWPVFFNLIKECRPAKVFGEQVERAIKHGWLDRVYTDMESENYACGAAVLGAHSVEAPHQRQRLYFGCVSVSDTELKQRKGSLPGCGKNTEEKRERQTAEFAGYCPDNSIPDTADNGHAGCGGANSRMDESESFRLQESGEVTACTFETSSRNDDISNLSHWSDFALVLCRDTDKNGNYKVRRVPAESVLLGMADELPESMDISRADRAFPLCQSSSFEKGQIAMLLKGYGNAIVPKAAAVFIKSFKKAIGE